MAIYGYKSKEELLDAIGRNYRLFGAEFEGIPGEDRDLRLPKVNRTLVEMLAYQIGQLPLIGDWGKTELSGQTPEIPTPGYKWGRLGKLYAEFYCSSGSLSLRELQNRLAEEGAAFVGWVTNLAEQEFFMQGVCRWTGNKLNWPVTRWIHVSSAAPFQTFRSKIHKWKRVRAAAAARATEREQTQRQYNHSASTVAQDKNQDRLRGRRFHTCFEVGLFRPHHPIGSYGQH